MWEIRQGDVLEHLREMEANSFDGCLTDPPYHLTTGKKGGTGKASVDLESPYGRARITTGFMGQEWDGGDIAFLPATWKLVLRVLKPGAHLLAFGGTRTHHRLMCAIEDAGFEIRDCCMWLYGSGFPKSMDISKAIDKQAGATGTYGEPKSEAHAGWIERGRMRGDKGHNGYQRPWMQDVTQVDKNAREYVPATEVARLFDGYGTALKPAWEPIIVAMKPLDGTFAGNALKYGVAGLNIDGSRIEPGQPVPGGGNGKGNYKYGDSGHYSSARPVVEQHNDGRWPANVILDEEAGAALDEQSGVLTSGALSPANNVRQSTGWSGGSQADRVKSTFATNVGGASRFFYCAKASGEDRDGNNHPTVKPVDLCRYLAKLIVPPVGGRLIVPFSGSGSEMLGALMAGWQDIVGIEREPAYIEIANRRLEKHCPLLAAL